MSAIVLCMEWNECHCVVHGMGPECRDWCLQRSFASREKAVLADSSQ